MSALVVVIAAALVVEAAPRGDVHHVLVLDDSGSMETDFDVHGFALAVPQLFQRMVGEKNPERLTVLTLAQGSPLGPVRRLTPGEYLRYERENGTFYAKAIAEAIQVAEASRAARVEIALVTDAEPSDPLARVAIDRALQADPRIGFRCFQLGTSDAGDLCVGRTHFARDGFDMARLMATHLAASFGSIPRWGRIEQGGERVPIPLGRYVSRLHVLLLGARAGEDFAAELALGGDVRSVAIDHTRPMMPADLLVQAARTGPKSPMELPVGPRPRLALGTLSSEAKAGVEPELRLVRADGPVAWGVILEYDLAVALEAPATIEPSAERFVARAHLTHRGLHVDDLEALRELGLGPTLVIERDGRRETVAMTLDANGWTKVEVQAPPSEARWSLVARFTSSTADLASPEVIVTRDNPARLDVTATPEPAPPAPTPTPTPAPTPSPTSAPTPAPTPISAWLPPTLTLPEWTIEGQTMTYTLTVVSADGRALAGDEIRAHSLAATIVLDGREHAMSLAGDRFEVSHPLPAAPHTLQAELVLRHPGGEIRSAPARMEILPDAVVRLLPSHDLGTVPAGCDLDAHCQPLDLTHGRALDRAALTVTRTDPYDDLTVTLLRGDEPHRLRRDHPLTLPPSSAPIAICWAPPGCTEAPADLHAALTIAPADPRLATPERSAHTRVFASEVTPSTWLACNLWWCLIVIGTLLTLFIVWGYVRPHAFPSGAFIQVADQERRLAKDPGRPLRSVPHGRRGFYRTATCAIDPSGFTVKRTRPHVVQLRADRGRIALWPRGSAVERRQRGQWVPIDRRAEPFLLSGATYRVNQRFVFRVLV